MKAKGDFHILSSKSEFLFTTSPNPQTGEGKLPLETEEFRLLNYRKGKCCVKQKEKEQGGGKKAKKRKGFPFLFL